MSYPLYEKECVVFEYDFSKEGGAVSSIPMRKLGANALLAGSMVVGAYLVVEEDVASASGSLSVGDGTDDDGFFVDLVAAGEGAYTHLGDLGGALLKETITLTDESDDIVGQGLALLLSDDLIPEVVIETDAVTAGKFKIVFDVIQFS